MRFAITKQNRRNYQGVAVPKWRLLEYKGVQRRVIATYDVDPDDPKNPPLEARRELLRLEEGIAAEPVPRSADDLTFQQLADDWIAEQFVLRDRGSIAQHWYENCETYKRQLVDVFGDRPLTDWVDDEPHFVGLFVARFGSQATKTQNNKKNALANILEPAVAKRILGHNPATAISIYATDHLATEEEIEAKSSNYDYDREFFRAMCAHALEVMPGCFGVMTNFLAMTGVHVGEATALRWRNLNMRGEYPWVHVVVSRRKAKDGWVNGGVKNTKKDKGLTKRDRHIPLPPDLVVMLRDWRVRSGASQDDDFVFPKVDGKPQNGADHFRVEQFQRHVEPFLAIFNQQRRAEGCGDVTPISPIDLRHFYATRLLQEYGADWGRVADLMGHSSADFTRRQYARRFSIMEAKGEVAVPATHRAIASGDFRL